jgi:hypothetical protein
MSTSDQTGHVDPTLANAAADQRIAFTSCKLGTTTFLTMPTREDALKAAFGTADSDFLLRADSSSRQCRIKRPTNS